MLNPNHPDDERLSALASGDPDEAADAGLTSHVSSCERCAGIVGELNALRASLADLPDVAPPRPLRLVPAVEAPRAEAAGGAAGWVRRLFAPALTAGAALAMVGLIGTTSPGALPSSLDEVGLGGGADAGMPAEDADGAAMEAGEERVLAQSAKPETFEDAAPGAQADDGSRGGTAGGDDDMALGTRDATEAERAGLPAERSPWPMVLFTGIALIVGALLLRWILVPRAG